MPVFGQKWVKNEQKMGKNTQKHPKIKKGTI